MPGTSKSKTDGKKSRNAAKSKEEDPTIQSKKSDSKSAGKKSARQPKRNDLRVAGDQKLRSKNRKISHRAESVDSNGRGPESPFKQDKSQVDRHRNPKKSPHSEPSLPRSEDSSSRKDRTGRRLEEWMNDENQAAENLCYLQAKNEELDDDIYQKKKELNSLIDERRYEKDRLDHLEDQIDDAKNELDSLHYSNDMNRQKDRYRDGMSRSPSPAASMFFRKPISNNSPSKSCEIDSFSSNEMPKIPTKLVMKIV